MSFAIPTPTAATAIAGPRAVRSLFVWGLYLYGAGGMLVGAPNVLLAMSFLPPAQEVWIRVVGIIVLILAYFSMMSARTANAEYMRWSVRGRYFAGAAFFAFVLLQMAGPGLAIFGAIDVAGASWTAWALRRDARG
jgi:hypothetical protein